jgi:hypothetical protein
VIRTAYRIFEDSRECFYFLPGIEIRDYRTDPEIHVCEIDLVWIRDGEFGAAEIKRKPNKLSISDKLAKLLDSALPDRLLLASPPGTEDEMREALSKTKSKISASIDVQTWGANIFSHSPHIGWNTLTYKVI